MRVVLKALPVLYTCQGCPEYGHAAHDLGAALDRAGVAEMVWLGAAANLQATRRYPVIALDGCDKGCALRWLRERGVAADHNYTLTAKNGAQVRSQILRDAVVPHQQP